MFSSQKAGLLKQPPSKDDLGGVKNKRTSLVEVYILRRILRDWIFAEDLARLKEETAQNFKKHLSVVSTTIAAFPGETANVTGEMWDGDADLERPCKAEAGSEPLTLEFLRDLHLGTFDATLRVFLETYPGGAVTELIQQEKLRRLEYLEDVRGTSGAGGKSFLWSALRQATGCHQAGGRQ